MTDVIRQSSMPQGTIHSNGWRSLLTLIAKPCVVTPRLTCTPIEAILRGSLVHTPVSPSIGPASTPASASDATIAASMRQM